MRGFYGPFLLGHALERPFELWYHVLVTQPRFIVVMDRPEQANWLQRAALHQGLPTRVIFRRYWPDGGDDNLHRKVAPEAWLDYMTSLGLDSGVLFYAGNEPTNLVGLPDWTLTALHLAEARGRGLVVGNFSTGNPPGDPLAYWRGPYAPVLEYLTANRRHLLGLHEYWRVSPDFEGTIPWLVGRFQFVLDAGFSPRIVLTESGYNLNEDWSMGSWRDAGLTPAAYYSQFEQAWELAYKDSPVEGACVFVWNSGGSEHKPMSVEDADDWKRLLELYHLTYPAPEPTPPTEPPGCSPLARLLRR